MKKNAFSPKKYIMEKGRICPIDQCLVSDGYDDLGLTICLIIRKQPGGKYMFTNLMLDSYCLGVKSVFCNCNFDDKQIEEVKDKLSNSVGEIEEVSPKYFHNLVYATIDFAEECGFKPVKDFALAEYILDPDLIDDGIDEIEVGDNGKPLFINGPYDDVDAIMAKLNRNLGEGNYDIMIGDGNFDF